MFYAFDKDWKTTYKLPFLNDLLEFEWKEIELFTIEDVKYDLYRPFKSVLRDKFTFSHCLALLHFKYPIHKMMPFDAIANTGNYYVVLYRCSDTFQINMLEVSPFWAIFIEDFINKPMTVDQFYRQYKKKLRLDMKLKPFHEMIYPFLTFLHEKKLVLRTK
jgi:hypothetical protein